MFKNTSQALTEKQHKQENARYDKNKKAYHKTLKIQAGLIPDSKTLPKRTTVKHPETGAPTSEPQQVIDIVTAHYTKELQCTTPPNLPAAPWTNPNNPDNFTLLDMSTADPN